MPPIFAVRHSIPVLFAALALPASAQSSETTLPTVTVTAAPVSAAASAAVGGFADTPVLETPASISVFDQRWMQERGIRQTTELARFEAGLVESYNAIGYAEQFAIRGFTLDNLSSYRKDGLIISSDAAIPLENKERIEVLKGLSGLQAGVSTPGGLLNYVTKRPTTAPLRSATVGADDHGALYGAVDLGGRSDDRRFGYRINAAAERLRSYVQGADGERQFVSGAFDWRLSPRSLLQLDLDHQRKSQVTVPGFQPLGGTELPTSISARTMLNDQSWSRPTETRSSNIGLRYEYQLDADWSASVAFNRHALRRDDFAAFPFGCPDDFSIRGFCGNGDYNIYDYQSEDESKQVLNGRAQVQGHLSVAGMRHTVTAGMETVRRRDRYGDCVYGTVDCLGSAANGVSNLYLPRDVPASPLRTSNVMLRRQGNERSFYLQDIVALADAWKLHAGIRHTRLERRQRYPERGQDERYEQDFVLPNVALVFTPRETLSVHASYAQGLEHGSVAPLFTTNQDTMLDPAKSRQLEFGARAQLAAGWSVSAALFRIEKPLDFIDDDFTWVRRGEARHDGLELAAQGNVTPALNVGLSVMALRSRQQDTGTAALEGRRVTNVPDFRSVAHADYAIARVPGLTVNGSWEYTASKSFTPDNSVDVPGYHLLNLGASYATRVGAVPATLRLHVDNVFDKFYWREASQQLGGYLFPGAPRTLRVTARFDF